MSEKKSFLEQMDTPVIKISAVTSAEPVRGHSRFNTTAPAPKRGGHCLPGRANHSWINGRCYWCSVKRGKR